ncbi:unnamed protein product, partial [Cyprideis torosa]
MQENSTETPPSFPNNQPLLVVPLSLRNALCPGKHFPFPYNWPGPVVPLSHSPLRPGNSFHIPLCPVCPREDFKMKFLICLILVILSSTPELKSASPLVYGSEFFLLGSLPIQETPPSFPNNQPLLVVPLSLRNALCPGKHFPFPYNWPGPVVPFRTALCAQ